MKESYVYGYYDKSGIPFYIGLGKGDRSHYHLKKSVLKTKKLPLFYNKLEKIILNNEKFEIRIFVKNISRFEAENIEQVLITEIGRRDLNKGPLCNLTDGGDGGMIGYIVSDETRARLSKKSKGRKLSKEHILAIKESNLGRKHTEESKRKMSRSQKGISRFAKNKKEFVERCKIAQKNRMLSEKCIENHKDGVRRRYRKKVVQSYHGRVIKEWDSQHDAIDFLKKGRTDRIIACCENKMSHHCGFNWSYA